MVIAGHGRLAAAEALGIAKVPVIVLKYLAPAQKEALRLADNRIAENASWDQALLRDALASVQTAEIDLAALGFSADELAGILAAAGDAVSDGDAPEALPADTAENPAAPAIGEDADDPADAEPEAPRHPRRPALPDGLRHQRRHRRRGARLKRRPPRGGAALPRRVRPRGSRQ